jgi:hypothetical protein
MAFAGEKREKWTDALRSWAHRQASASSHTPTVVRAA